MNSLNQFGWTAQTQELWLAQNYENAQPARVVRVDRGLVTVVATDGEHRLSQAGRLRQSGEVVAVGDWAVITAETVTGLLPRRNALVRRDTDGSASGQIIAANVDLVLVAVPLTEAVRVRKLERYLAFARSSAAEPLVVLTKSDLCQDLPAAVADAVAVSGGAAVHTVSAVSGAGVGEVLTALKPGMTVVVVGPSGAGKSTLANALGIEREQATGAIRGDGKGRHTTTRREMLRLDGGALLIDTPGLRSLELWDAEAGIASTFADVAELAAQCRFRDCSHRTEPGCAVNAAVAEGRLTGDRIDGFVKLQREEERLAAKVDSRLRAERSRQLRAFHRSLRDQPSR
ncbi:MAG: ribosome biosis GTPase / thiamine phosphate phosphatase [Frankiales bacterium]|nr:ribosome biosis GTPase / thiamine phosphate phosphatase [Frankiales bacterium]